VKVNKRALGLRASIPLVGLAVAGLLLTACGGSGESAQSTDAVAEASEQASAPSSEAAPMESEAPATDGLASIAADLDALRGPITWPEITALSSPVDLSGKTVWWIPIGDAIPVINGFGKGMKEAVEAAGGTFKLCDGKFNPADIGNCLQQAADQNADAVATAFIDYAMLPTAFDALNAKGIPVLIAGVGPTGGAEATETLAFFDPSGQVMKMYETISKAGLSVNGEATNALWLRLLDSSLTTNGSDAGVAKFKELCPDCPLATADFTTANADKLPSQVSAELVKAPDINTILVPNDSFVPPVLQGLKTAGRTDVAVVSNSGELQNMQLIKDGQQAGTIGTPVIFTGWQYANALMQLLVGDAVTPANDLTNRYFDASNIEGLEITPEAYVSSKWYGDDSFKEKFLAAWGIQ